MDRKSDVLVLLGAVVGGLLGYVVFFAIARRGFYGLALPGGLLGLGAGIFKTRSKAVAVACGLSALALGYRRRQRYTSAAVATRACVKAAESIGGRQFMSEAENATM